MSLDRIDLALRMLAERDAATAKIANLPPRQRQAAMHLGQGLDSAQIGAHMSLTPGTVNVTIHNACEALELTRLELAVLACKAGMG
mgnify:CR=1 FL=1